MLSVRKSRGSTVATQALQVEMSGPSKTERTLQAQMRAQKEEFRKRTERDPQLRKDFDFLIEKTGLQPHQLVTGLWLDCNLMRADRQTLLRNAKKEAWPIDEDTRRRNITNIRRVAGQIRVINQTEFSPFRTISIGDQFAGLPEILRSYAKELERKVEIWSPYWQRKRSRIPTWVELTRQNSLYERIRSSAERYHQTRLLRLVNVMREIMDYRRIEPRAFAIWLNRVENRRKEMLGK